MGKFWGLKDESDAPDVVLGGRKEAEDDAPGVGPLVDKQVVTGCSWSDSNDLQS